MSNKDVHTHEAYRHKTQQQSHSIFKHTIFITLRDRYLEQLIWDCPRVNAKRPHWWFANIGSGNGLVPSGNTVVVCLTIRYGLIFFRKEIIAISRFHIYQLTEGSCSWSLWCCLYGQSCGTHWYVAIFKALDGVTCRLWVRATHISTEVLCISNCGVWKHTIVLGMKPPCLTRIAAHWNALAAHIL